LREENVKMRDSVGRRLVMAVRRRGGEEKGRGSGLVPHGGRRGAEREGPGCGRGGSEPLGQWWAVHVAWARRMRMSRGGGGRARRWGSG
jgi:hypothetical protein